MNIAQRLQDKGREEGIQQGRLEGKLEGRQEGKLEGKKEASIDIARTLLKRGDSIEVVMEITGLSRAELITLQS